MIRRVEKVPSPMEFFCEEEPLSPIEFCCEEKPQSIPFTLVRKPRSFAEVCRKEVLDVSVLLTYLEPHQLQVPVKLPQKEKPDVAELRSKLENILKCPICLEVLEPPVVLCESGHGICEQCTSKNKLLDCPLCRKPVVKSKATVLDQVLEILPRSCKYRSEGCLVISLAEENHMKYCEFRKTKCLICGRTTSVNSLFIHYEKNHKSRKVFLPSTGSEQFMALLKDFGHLFWRNILLDVEKQFLTVTYSLIPIGKPTKKYLASIKFTKDDLKYSSVSMVKMGEDSEDLNFKFGDPNIIVPIIPFKKQTEIDEFFSCLNIKIQEEK